MRSISTLIIRHFFAQALLPILLIEFSLVITLFLLNNYQSEQNKNALELITKEAFIEIAHQTTARINQHFIQAKNDLNQLTDTSEIFFTMRAQRAENPQNYQLYDGFFQYAPPHVSEKGFYKYTKPKSTTVYTTNLKELQPDDYGILNSLVPLAPIAKTIIETPRSLITNIWINIDKRYAFAYPPINPVKELKPTLDVTEHSFYCNADPVHNPDKNSLFVPLYKKSWALRNGELGTYVKPLYLDNHFIGVAGFTLNVKEIANVINGLDLPFEAQAMLMDKENTLIASSNPAAIEKDFKTHSFYQMHKEQTAAPSGSMTINMKTLAASRFIEYTMPVKGTDLKIVIYVEKAAIFAPITMVSERTVHVGIIFIIAIAFFYLFFFWFNLGSLKRLAAGITQPLQAIVAFSSQLGREEDFHLENSKITELETLNTNLNYTHQELLDMLIRDQESGLFNRRKLLSDLLETKAHCLMLLHIHNYRALLQYYGQEGVLTLLESIIAILRNEDDIEIYRIADNELALFLPYRQQSYFRALLQQLNALHVTYNTVELHPFIYGGISKIENDGSELEKATLALQNALDNKISTPIYFKEEFDRSEQVQTNLLWAGRLKAAIAEDRIMPYFQPIYNIRTERIEKFEALVRMEENGEILSPYHFLESAEKMGRMHEITLLMIEKVFGVAARYPKFTFSINLSFKDIQDALFLDHIIGRCKHFDIEAHQIVFELLETEAIDDPQRSIRFFTELKRAGFGIAIDDFGTGHSNFANLSMMQADFIKIDGQFIKDMTQNPNSLAITKSISEFAKVMGAQTIAEFVKDDKTLLAVKELHIDYAQGFVISPAVPESEIDGLLDRVNG
ncbi:EAL domain-containing protein [Sulfurimonas sp. HSL3-7]|uniref:EAL domain-containing protein n=1 Tax=Sulfonitrofixus jiaomeiensis TaxID=3131938 RepID=UPI0031F8632C